MRLSRGDAAILLLLWLMGVVLMGGSYELIRAMLGTVL
jgi:hypothetical protein